MNLHRPHDKTFFLRLIIIIFKLNNYFIPLVHKESNLCNQAEDKSDLCFLLGEITYSYNRVY